MNVGLITVKGSRALARTEGDSALVAQQSHEDKIEDRFCTREFLIVL